VKLIVAASLLLSLFGPLRSSVQPNDMGANYNFWTFSFYSKAARSQARPQDASGYPDAWKASYLTSIICGKLADTVQVKQIIDLGNVFALYNLFWLGCLFLIIIAMVDEPILPMLGIAAGMFYNMNPTSEGYLLPWDTPSMFFFTLVFLFYQRKMFVATLATIFFGSFIRETIFVCALLPAMAAPWRHRFLISSAVVPAALGINHFLTPVHTMPHVWHNLLIMRGAMENNAKILFSWAAPCSPVPERVNLFHLFFVNAGGLAIAAWAAAKLKDWPTIWVFISFAIAEFTVTAAHETRTWLDLLPIAWILLSQLLNRAETTSSIPSVQNDSSSNPAEPGPGAPCRPRR
jgi:hypothetical protein